MKDQLNIENKLLNTLIEVFHLPKFRLGQQAIISSILQNKDVLAVLPTGGGKSLCYQLPAVYTKQLVIVVSPLIALMRDQVSGLKKLNIPAGCLYSGQSDSEKREIFSNINKGGTFILYLSPERVQKEGFKRWILDKKIALFSIDEAHCVSQWGHDFREEYNQLNLLKELRPDVPLLALTASATPLVLNDIVKQLNLKNPERHVHGFYRPNLYYQVQICEDDQMKFAYLCQSLLQTPVGRVIVYCGTRKLTEELAATLQKNFSGVGFYHAGLSTKDRTEAQTSYGEGRLRILVATNAFGMGIDHPDVRLVVHYNMPANIDSLYQEMGRAGRDGLESTCLMLYSRKDKGLQSFFIQNSEASPSVKKLRWRNLDTLIDYSESEECRHAEILTYYRDAERITRCGHCDSCAPKSNRKILMPSHAILRKNIKNQKKKQKEMDLGELNPSQVRCLNSLKEWRKLKALSLDVPAFVIFSDKTLRQIVLHSPKNFDELQNIHGIGEAKLSAFGTDLLALLR